MSSFGFVCILCNSNYKGLNSHLNLGLLQTSIEKDGMKEVPYTLDRLMVAVDKFLTGEFLG